MVAREQAVDDVRGTAEDCNSAAFGYCTIADELAIADHDTSDNGQSTGGVGRAVIFETHSVQGAISDTRPTTAPTNASDCRVAQKDRLGRRECVDIQCTTAIHCHIALEPRAVQQSLAIDLRCAAVPGCT